MKKILLTFLILTMLTRISCSTNTTDTKKLFEQFIVQQEFKKHEQVRKDNIINAIMRVESNFNKLAFNVDENAAGVLQIRPVMVRAINRIVGYEKFTLEDRWNIGKSKEMFIIFQDYFNPLWDAEVAARIWNGGEKGMAKTATKKYWEKVYNILQS